MGVIALIPWMLVSALLGSIPEVSLDHAFQFNGRMVQQATIPETTAALVLFDAWKLG